MVADITHRGDIWMVSLDPVGGIEIGKTRPARVISNDRNNQYAETITVIPVTSHTGNTYPFEALLSPGMSGLSLDSRAKCNQVRTLSKKRLVRKLGTISPGEMALVEKALLLHLGMFHFLV